MKLTRRGFLKAVFATSAVTLSTGAVGKTLLAPVVYRGEVAVVLKTYDSHNIQVNGDDIDTQMAVSYHSHVGISKHTYSVTSNDTITVTAFNGVKVSFRPQWNTVTKRFDDVVIDTYFENEEDKNYQEVTTLTATFDNDIIATLENKYYGVGPL